MELYGYIAVFAFGLIIGSFCNVVIYRLHTGRSLAGRSHCLSCGTCLKWYELMPLVSYLALRGRCRTCYAYIPMRYACVELCTAALFALVWHVFGHDLVLVLLHFVLVSVLVVVFVYDVRHAIIPDETVIILLLIAAAVIIYAAAAGDTSVSQLMIRLGVGVLTAAFFAAFWLFSGGRWMGLGDAKLALPLAILAGPAGAPAFVVLSFWIGAVISLAIIGVQYVVRRGLSRPTYAAPAVYVGRGTTQLLILRTRLKMKSEIPFAPFLILGFGYTYFSHVDIFDIIFWFSF